MSEILEEARDLEVTEETKEGLFVVDNGKPNEDAWLDLRDGFEYYAYGKNGLVENPEKPRVIHRLEKKHRGKDNARLTMY